MPQTECMADLVLDNAHLLTAVANAHTLSTAD
jgi:hypothetical protein